MLRSGHCTAADLADRGRFLESIEQALARAFRSQQSIAVLYLDLDGFNGVNDELGHAAGDDVLRVVSQRLASSLSTNAMATRIGGDEFAVLLSDLVRPMIAGATANELARAISEPIAMNGCELCVQASIGIAVFPTDGNESVELLRHAHLAMYYAKQEGRNRPHFYCSTFSASFLRLSTERAMRRAASVSRIRRPARSILG